MKPIRLPFWQFSRDDVCPTEHVLAEGVSDTASPVGPGREPPAGAPFAQLGFVKCMQQSEGWAPA
jgi:hypothetical protein